MSRHRRFTYPYAWLAYNLCTDGSDWQDIHVRHVERGVDEAGVLGWVKFAPVAWKIDNSGFYYARCPAPGEMPAAPPIVPMHAMKFAATLQSKDSGVHPILMRIETQAGHGMGKPTGKLTAAQTDIYAFLFNSLNEGEASST